VHEAPLTGVDPHVADGRARTAQTEEQQIAQAQFLLAQWASRRKLLGGGARHGDTIAPIDISDETTAIETLRGIGTAVAIRRTDLCRGIARDALTALWAHGFASRAARARFRLERRTRCEQQQRSRQHTEP